MRQLFDSLVGSKGALHLLPVSHSGMGVWGTSMERTVVSELYV